MPTYFQIYLDNLTYIFECEKIYLPLHKGRKVADKHLHIRRDDICNSETKAMGPSFKHMGDWG